LQENLKNKGEKDKKEVKQTGSITKVNLDQGDFNLADFVLEK